MADIFLSYTEKDRESARRVATMLESAGWTVWWDRRIPAGDTWRSVLEHALEGMRCMIVLWTARSIESEWVYEEATEGRRQGKLVPVMLEAVRPPAGFREIQAADLTGWDGTAGFEGWRMLLADLDRLLGHPGSPQAGPDPILKIETSGPPYDPDDLPPRETKTVWPPRRVLAWALAGLLPLAGITAYFGLRQPAPAVVVQPPKDPTGPADIPVSTTPQPLPKQAESPPRKVPATTVTAASPTRPPVASQGKRSNSARCADLLSRMQLGESLSDEAQSVLQKECKQ